MQLVINGGKLDAVRPADVVAAGGSAHFRRDGHAARGLRDIGQLRRRGGAATRAPSSRSARTSAWPRRPALVAGCAQGRLAGVHLDLPPRERSFWRPTSAAMPAPTRATTPARSPRSGAISRRASTACSPTIPPSRAGPSTPERRRVPRSGGGACACAGAHARAYVPRRCGGQPQPTAGQSARGLQRPYVAVSDALPSRLALTMKPTIAPDGSAGSGRCATFNAVTVTT